MLAEIARILQYAGASGLCGAALFGTFAAPALKSELTRPIRRLAWGSAIVLLLGGGLAAVVQSAMMNGLPLMGLTPDAVTLVMFETGWGQALSVRLVLVLAAVVLAWLRPPGRMRSDRRTAATASSTSLRN